MPADSPDSPFDPDDVAAVAADNGLETDRLETLLADHQSLMAETPGVENLVYEWRKQFDATLLARTESVYVVDAPPWAWAEFVEALDAASAEGVALRTVHRQTAAAREDVTLEGEEATPMVLRR